MCVALLVLEASVHVTGPKGNRVIPIAEFHRLPGDTPEIDTNLAGDELITAIELPPRGFARNHTYIKIRDRLSYAFALVSVAAGLELEAGTIKLARVALGGVAHKPWRIEAAEALLQGQEPARAAFAKTADAILESASGFAHNRFKIELARRTIVRALEQAAAGTPQPQAVKAIL
jgi:xanthine dehydrogenase YagS FAD-binding subunit